MIPRSRLFWKILLGFWLTFFVTMETLWLLFVYYRGQQPPSRVNAAPDIAILAMDSAAAAIARGGPEALALTLSGWPRNRADLVAIAPAAAAPPPDAPGRYVRTVSAPDGRSYRLVYDASGIVKRLSPVQVPRVSLIAGALGGLAFSAVLAWYLTLPITRLRGGFDRLARGELGTRLAPGVGSRRDELADLARDFDSMAARLEHLVESRDRLLHDVSHELRSPLARMHLALGLARQNPANIEASLARIESEAGRLDGLVGEILSLSRAEIAGADCQAYFDLARLLAAVIDDARFEARAQEVRVLADIPEPGSGTPTVAGHAELLRRAFENIVRNALRFSRPGQAVEVSLAAIAERSVYAVTIEDQGPGVPETSLETIFEPFVRGADPGQGYGLGLSIARRAIAAHGGTISAENRTGGGLAVTVTLPFGPAGEED